jgi:hypothetical protein
VSQPWNIHWPSTSASSDELSDAEDARLTALARTNDIYRLAISRHDEASTEPEWLAIALDATQFYARLMGVE